MDDELAPPEPPYKPRSAIEDDTIISYGAGEYTFGLTLAQTEDGSIDQEVLEQHLDAIDDSFSVAHTDEDL